MANSILAGQAALPLSLLFFAKHVKIYLICEETHRAGRFVCFYF